MWSTFSLGPLNTSALIVEGDGVHAIGPDAVRRTPYASKS